MALELEFIINDESVNRYGYRVLSAGIQTGNFLKNPVCLVQHRSEYLSVGKWKELKVAGNKFIAKLEFDEGDEEAVKIYNKYKNGYMSAVSISILEITESEDPKYLLPGQKYPTILECELLEISLVTVPGNANSLKLMNKEGKEKQLSLLTENVDINQNQNKNMTEEQLKAENDKLRKQLAAELADMHCKRGVITASELDFYKKAAENDYDGTKKVLEAKVVAKAEDNTNAKQLAAQLVEMHQKRGAITATELAFYTKAAEGDYEGTKKVLEAKKGTEGLEKFVNNLSNDKNANSDTEDRSKWGFKEWYQKDLDGLQKMETEKPEDYKKLQLSYRNQLKSENVYIPTEE
jgi:hypothetical protein